MQLSSYIPIFSDTSMKKYFLLTPQIQLAESSLTRDSTLELIFGVQYMLGARWRTKTECFKIHYRAEVEIKVETLIFYDKVRQSVLRCISNKKNT